MKNIGICCIAILLSGLLHAQYGVMTKSYIRKDTICVLSPEDFYPRSIIFVDQKITEGGHTDHIRYVDMGDGNTIAWPEILSVKKAYALLNNDSSATTVVKDIRARTGLMDFLFFWKTTYKRTMYRYSLVWPYEGPPSFSEPEQVGESKIIRKFERKKNLIFFFILIAFVIGFVVGWQRKKILESFKQTPKISWMTVIMFPMLLAMPFLTTETWYDGLIDSIPLTTAGLLGILIGVVYQKKKGNEESTEPEKNTNDSRLPD